MSALGVYVWLTCGQSLGPFPPDAPEVAPGRLLYCSFCHKEQTAWAQSDHPASGDEVAEMLRASEATCGGAGHLGLGGAA